MANSCDIKSDSSEPSEKDRGVSALYPVVLGSPETTLDIDSGSASSDSEEWTQEVAIPNGNALPPASTINVENSSDVVIGPLTQFHGPVTIYQNISSETSPSPAISGVECKSDITLNSTAKLVARDGSSDGQQPLAKFLLTTPNKKAVVLVVIALAIVAAIVASLVILINTSSQTNNFTDYSPTTTSTSKTPAMKSHKIYSKQDWGGREPVSPIDPLAHPTEYVIIAHTVGRVCKNFNQCSQIMQLIQADHVSSAKRSDIAYNFLIGGDGNIYVGRGWDAQNILRDGNIAVSFTGNFVYDTLTPDMISALRDLLALGVQLKKLSPDYKLVCHNQTAATLSPGKNAYQEISKFPHFYTGPITI